MKFYINYNWSKIRTDRLTVIYSTNKYILFFKDGKEHNKKNASYYSFNNNFKCYYLNNKPYGINNDFNKQSWRKFVRELKLRAFL